MYRPQFVFPPPGKGCQDRKCPYSFDSFNTPALGNIPNGNPVNVRIPLVLDQDADFFLRGVQIFVTAVSAVPTTVQVGLLDCFGNQLIDPLLAGNPPTLYPYLWSFSSASPTGGGGIVTLDSDPWGIYCPAAGALAAYISNTAGFEVSVIINLDGVKRYRGEQCF